MSLVPFSRSRWRYLLELISRSFILFHLSICLFFVPVSCCFCYYRSLVQVELEYCDTSPSLFFLLRIALAIQGLLYFHMNFKIVFSIFVKNVIAILMGGLH
jgi:hypothetical protein